MNKILKLKEVAEFIGVPRRTLYDMIADRRFSVPPIKGTKPRRWNQKDVENWLNNKSEK